ncbi:MAG TPA: hypothetical protein VGM73_11435 [Candidatus Didemnitutus sp.]
MRSDFVLWHASIAIEAATLLDAQENLRADATKLASFLRQHGLNDFSMSPPQIQELLAKRHHKEDDTTENFGNYPSTNPRRAYRHSLPARTKPGRPSRAVIR